ncbi:hypothetical protein AMTRI_Chr01g126600 [Amborella trichopoda]|uniref:Uncharacterized protein n=1 Tax=Amborella trichopoda TaxID=13333 RepID=W1NQ62_AMBTC|nr:myb-like protein AA [Amborella trichopoda]ERM97255.1 hypothetical protein AMTR_s00119p00105590 [Amborella trichopoda]|eukprot:XP_006829839.3 myb-like protein AA [Amborella trichopoda]
MSEPNPYSQKIRNGFSEIGFQGDFMGSLSYPHQRTSNSHSNSNSNSESYSKSPKALGLFSSSSSGETQSKREMGFQVLSPAKQSKRKVLSFQSSMEDSERKGGTEDCYRDERESHEEEPMGNCGGKENEDRHSKLCARGHWRPAEDAKLKELVAQFGPQNWNVIAERLEGRSGKSCRLRWFNQLDPRINRRAFSEEEEERLLAAHRLYGNKWAMIARLFPGRTDNAVKNHWHVIMARKYREQSNAYRRRKSLPQQQQPTMQRKVETSNGRGASDSSILSNRDESASTCTDLSLNSSNSRAFPGFYSRFGTLQHQGEEEKNKALGNGTMEKSEGPTNGFYFSLPPPPQMVLLKQSDSEFLQTSSMVGESRRERDHQFVYGEINHKSEKMNLLFIDFLGVGAT